MLLVVTAEVENVLRKSVVEIEKEKNLQVSIKILSRKQPNANLYERTKFP
jgi:phosphoribosylaminoimidazole carboxylase (NCAIR synthetase)